MWHTQVGVWCSHREGVACTYGGVWHTHGGVACT